MAAAGMVVVKRPTETVESNHAIPFTYSTGIDKRPRRPICTIMASAPTRAA